MQTAWNEVLRLIRENATHRRGFRLGDVSPAFVLLQAREEFAELEAAPRDPTELADLLGVLIHYAIKQGWELEYLEELLIHKLRLRFQTFRFSNGSNANGNSNQEAGEEAGQEDKGQAGREGEGHG